MNTPAKPSFSSAQSVPAQSVRAQSVRAQPVRARAIRNMALASCLLALAQHPLSAQTNEMAAQFNDAPVQAADFASEFADIAPPADPSLVDIDLALPDNAVDLGTFEAPREVPPKPRPASSTVRDLGTGVASYYGRRFHGRLTANGERFNMNAMTGAHKTLPFGTRVRVTNPRNGRSVTVRINDRGPFIRGRTIDLSRGAAQKLGMISSGHATVKLDIVSR